jgi:hypothetical protein
VNLTSDDTPGQPSEIAANSSATIRMPSGEDPPRRQPSEVAANSSAAIRMPSGEYPKKVNNQAPLTNQKETNNQASQVNHQTPPKHQRETNNNSLGNNHAPRKTHSASNNSHDNSQKKNVFCSLNSDSIFSFLNDSDCKSQSRLDSVFIIDSGCTRHMVSSKYPYLKNRRKLATPVRIQFADLSTIEAKETGDILFGDRILSNTLCLDIQLNLLSVRMLAEEHGILTILGKYDGIAFTRDEIVADFKVDPSSGLYIYETGPDYSLSASEKPKHSIKQLDDQLLHEIFGHASAEALTKLLGRKIVLSPCSACAEGKMRQKKHMRRLEHELRLLAHLSSDIIYAGVRSIDGALYFCTLLDEASRYLWIILLRSTKNLHESLIPLIKKEQRKLGVDVLRLTTDGGTEYASKNLAKFLLDEGLDHRVIPRYEHASNGLIEHANQRVTEIAAAMLYACGLSLPFWSFSVSYAALIYNILPNSALNWKSPHEAYFGECFNTSKIILFGSKVMVHLPKEIRTEGKFSPKAEVGIFLGYDPLNHTNIIYLPNSNLFTESRSIKTGFGFFTEDELRTWGISRKHADESRGTADDDEDWTESDSDDDEEDASKVDDSVEENHYRTEDYTGSETQIRKSNRKASAEASERIKLLSKETDELNLLLSALPSDSVPRSWKEAILIPEWKESMQREIDALKEYQTWNLVEPEPDKKLHNCIWVFRRKSDGTAKSRLTFDGSKQTIEDVYASVGTKTSLRTLLKLIVQLQLKAKHIDISNAFVHGSLEENEQVFMRQPPGFREKGSQSKVCKLLKSLYGLRQAPRIWKTLLENILTKFGLKPLHSDSCLLVGKNLFVFVYVDDLIVAGKYESDINKLYEELAKNFPVKDLGFPEKVLGIEITKILKNDGKFELFIHQKSYAESLIEKFAEDMKMIRTTPVDHVLETVNPGEEVLNSAHHKLYQQIVGSILYLAVCTRPDLSYCSSILGKFSAAPTFNHLKAAYNSLAYIKGTTDLGLLYQEDDFDEINCFSDSDHCSERDRLIRIGFVVFWGTSPLDWMSKKFQGAISLSSSESEFYAATVAATHGYHVRNMITELKTRKPLNHETRKQLPQIKLWIDNKPCIKILERDGFHYGIKHVDIRYMWIKLEVKEKRISIGYINTKDQPADIFTKPLKRTQFNHQKLLNGLRQMHA